MRTLERTSVQFEGWVERYASLALAVARATQALPDPHRRPDLPACQRSIESSTEFAEATTQEYARARSRFDAASQAKAGARGALTQVMRKCQQAQTALDEAGVDGKILEDWLLTRKTEKERQRCAPWSDRELDALRHTVFIEALALHRSFIAANASPLRRNLSLWVDMIKGVLPAGHVAAGAEHLWESFFLCVPVSTTFHALPTLFRGMGEKSLGWLLIDEAGQVTPQAAVCGIVRAKRTIVVGDPLQLEPVFTLPARIVDALEDRLDVSSQWNPRRASCQALSDRANRYGTLIQDKWVGAPLRVHRRCIEPMFSVANEISYENMMVYGTEPSANESQWLGPSCWVDVPSQSGNGHWIPEQGRVALALFDAVVSFDRGEARRSGEEGRPNAFIIAPFRDVADNAQRLLSRRGFDDADEFCGTVHTFQGKESDVVILLLGGNLKKPGAISSFAAKQPNLLNVALTRARRRIYVVGQRDQWAGHSFYSLLADRLPTVTAAQILGSGESNQDDWPPTGQRSRPRSNPPQNRRRHG